MHVHENPLDQLGLLDARDHLEPPAAAPARSRVWRMGREAGSMSGLPFDPTATSFPTSMSTAASRPRVLVIGLAEATLDLILPWVEAGLLPTFKRLMEEGMYGPLRSRVPFITPQMWGTIYTGTSAGQHGALDFWQRGEDGKFREINGSHLRTKPVWEMLGAAGYSSGVVNLPFTYPPPAINGYVISGEDAPGAHRSIANPPGLYDELTATLGRYRLKDIFPGGRKKSDYLTLVEEDVTKQTDVLEYLIRNHPTDLFFTFYSATAICQHYFWSDMESSDADNPYRQVVEKAYRTLDTSIDRLMKAAGPDAQVFVMSECGAGPLQSGVNLNAWLAQEGFLVYRSKGRSGNGSATDNRMRTMVAGARTHAQGLLQRLPRSLYYLANRYLRNAKALMQSYIVNSDIDWKRTRAFSRGKEGNIFVNMRGRDPHGIVEQQNYGDLCRNISEKLYALVDPATGKPAVERVYLSDELYRGPLQRIAPDVTVFWRDGLYSPHEGRREDTSIFVKRWREYMNWPTTGGHNPHGILFAKGPGIRHGRRIEGASILDLTPTMLRAFRQPIPASLEGRVIQEIFEPTE
jgi:predicted AlkP superfamily phosphohydrolase/phosphomutase